MEKEFNRQLNDHLNQWVQNSQSSGWSAIEGNFFNVDEDSSVKVNLNKLSEDYKTKKIVSQPANYCNAFLQTIEPYLVDFLVQFGVKSYKFRFVFVLFGTIAKDYFVSTK
ncbi:hypothetical protein HDF26_002438 [Pedobacter cryoconitis]|uniref:Uncharacterized protein n=1 Tax=Pedobacter cryoconitis TaxID=188932 RepID=A0A7W8ZJ05_9SPHI|nr:hypothetical protein [Pedobacter cryoconitis]MBB5634886.1 hypothetical protein [Pedobacter cryoconitis]MBB6271981.1 hypothetical protein [Pedobacter cryoconitis]